MALFLAFFYGSPRARAQTVVTDTESGLKYIDDGDGLLYIWVGGSALPGLETIDEVSSNTYFISDGGLRSNWRQNHNGDNGKWYKTALDVITTFEGVITAPKHTKVSSISAILSRLLYRETIFGT
ncbi:MAG: hypothetical protein J6I34_06260 [Prevotella sp.]|nr:hypothetical protein [Prevotella sp.]